MCSQLQHYKCCYHHLTWVCEGNLKIPHLLLALALAFVLGFVVSPTMVISNTMVHQLTDNSMRGKVFSSLEIVVHLGFLLAMMISAALADHIGSVNILLTVSFLLALIGIGGMLRSLRVRSTA